MNRKLRSSTSRTCAKYFSVGLLTTAFLISSEMPLLASPPQDSQSNSSQSSSSQASAGPTGASQAGTTKAEDSLPDAPQATPQAQTGQHQEHAPSGTAGGRRRKSHAAPR